MSAYQQVVTITHRDGNRTAAGLTVPEKPLGIVVFAHGAGSSRHSPRNQMVAATLNQRRLATLLVDLLTQREDAAERRGAMLRFDVELLAARLMDSLGSLRADAALRALPIGYFGASTGAA